MEAKVVRLNDAVMRNYGPNIIPHTGTRPEKAGRFVRENRAIKHRCYRTVVECKIHKQNIII